MEFIDVGFSNYVDTEKIVGFGRPDSSPIKRRIKEAREEGKLVDFTQGRKTRSVIFSSCGNSYNVICSYLSTNVIIERIRKLDQVVTEKRSGDLIEVQSC